MRDLKWFDSLDDRDFRNGAVRDEIREVFKDRDELKKEVDDLGLRLHQAYVEAMHRETGR